ncbi:glycosyltransferase family 4 protein [Anabaenopsis elenkinii]|jgi:glycosyltransferase involved in cell wall biosynthesis|uniref:Glycosyltransferase family 4 protein n=1 Tax=Anabaenopsis elenkinii CCIBt3563 TaxID=2779889 RepID=A0A7S6U6B2_9CYAN|nr:glycosyltransferase family 4 protein [Anabaenopsis elenkinii]QOV22708.1 glycosyltransferase family 4 protein [Anabaenopsis elenkinii CCIBt3563]
MKKLIVYIAEVILSEESGMGRVAWHWKNEFESRGYEFLHIGPSETGRFAHKAFFPYAARRFYKKLAREASVFIVHEPASGFFLSFNIPVVVVSHGLERRSWELELQDKYGSSQKLKLRTKLLFPLWRLHYCDLGLRKGNLLLLLNQEDCEFTKQYYHRNSQDIFLYKNGIYPYHVNETPQINNPLTILFMGSWIERKGIKTLVDAAQILHKKGLTFHWLLAGTGLDHEAVLAAWPKNFHPYLEIIPKFLASDELSLFMRSQIFVLPSFFEGQPLVLLQAMASGRCCITTNCCGQKDLIRHGDNGLLYEGGNAGELAYLIQQCANDSQLRTTLGKNAKTSVENRSWKEVSAEVVNRVEALIQ